MSEAYVAHSADEVLVNSGEYDGHDARGGGRHIVRDLRERGLAEPAVTYRLRDWLVGRQRGWGAPIPVVYCEADPSCGIVPVPYEQLPIELPTDIETWPAQGNPLETHEAFLRTSCPKCGGPGRRETDTMDTFVDSSWYWWRYLSVDENERPINTERARVWCPVKQYTGGAEHAVLHLMYARFFAKALNDLGMVQEREPWLRLFNQGQILGADGERMSKSRGNVQDPDELVQRYGADTVRLFLMFMGPWDQGGPWSPTGIDGVHRFLRRVWTVVTDPHGVEPGDPEAGQLPKGENQTTASEGLRRMAHRTLRKVTEDHDDYRWNTMIASMMELTNRLIRLRGSAVAGGAEWDETVKLLLLMLAPIAPHISEELWSRRLAERGDEWQSIHTQEWPEYAEELMADSSIELPVQVNGKLRDLVRMPPGLSEIEIEQIVMSRDKVLGQLEGQEVVRVIQVPGRLVNVVTRPRDS
jgi:leucyl-tRNA synthetase